MATVTGDDGVERDVLEEHECTWAKVVWAKEPDRLNADLPKALRELYDSGHNVTDVKLTAKPEALAAVILYRKQPPHSGARVRVSSISAG